MQKSLNNPRAILVFVGPAILLYSAVLLIPIIWSIGYTVFEGSAISGFTFVGLQNYLHLFQDKALWTATWFSVKYATVVSMGQVLFGLLLALMYAFYIKRFSALVRTLIFFPVILPTVAVAQMFSKLFELVPQPGLVNSLLLTLNFESLVQAWLANGTTAFWVLCIMDIWKAMGFYALIIYAGLVDVPGDVLEAARMDNAKGWSLVRYVVLPLIRPIMISSFIFSLNGTLKVFDSVLALTGGGPGNSTTPLTLYMYKTAFTYNQYGYGSTIAVFLTMMCLLVTLLIYKFARNDDA